MIFGAIPHFHWSTYHFHQKLSGSPSPRTLKMWHRTQQQHSHPQSNPNVTYFLQNLKILFLTFNSTLKKLIFSFLFFYISIFFLSFLYLFSSLCAFLLSISFSFLSHLPSFFLLIFCFSHYACSLSLSPYAFSFHGKRVLEAYYRQIS